MSVRIIVPRIRRRTAQGRRKCTHSNTRRRTRKREVDVPAGWIDSDMPQHQRITRALSISQYRLKPSDVNKLRYRTGVSLDGHPVRLYLERSVEGLAWDRYGSNASIITTSASTGTQARSLLHSATNPAVSTTLHSPIRLPYDPYVGHSQRLQQAKARLPAWLWEACNAALDRAALHDSDARSQAGTQPSLSDSRKAAMQRAVRFARGYPPRDRRTRCLSSPWIVCFRNVLKGAPKLPSRRTWGVRVDDLEFFAALGHRPGHHGQYEWSGVYVGRVLQALRNVFVSHGDRQTVRHCVLWELYDAYSKSLGCGIRYDPVAETWSDPAAAWLDIDGQSPAEAVQDALRRRRPAGLRRANHNFVLSPMPSQEKAS